ncbi:phenylalanine-tRNA synthetase [Trichodelitschia bisporula]|uniref:Phenylalanine--tRNA ligase, mitochondrial n=1 Tax=Trichodelitschia bisporula TaxID=703511 RepID=A0A6G1I996_9PEZI|nr:phenylalanine-tRNA synthetase [Trichodelitschia bisporula]
MSKLVMHFSAKTLTSSTMAPHNMLTTRTARLAARLFRETLCFRCQRRLVSSSYPPTLTIGSQTYPTDSWTNTPSSILAAIPRKLHLQDSHPLALTRSLIESRFPRYTSHTTLPAVVTTHQNFDSLSFPPNHPGRSPSDTYYINSSTVLRTHTSAHQADLFRASNSPFLIAADVYRRDAIDRSHYPVFHQIEGAHTWSMSSSSIAEIRAETEAIPAPPVRIEVEDTNPPFHAQRNPLQAQHDPELTTAMAAHLKRSLEGLIGTVFARAPRPASQANEPIKARWVEAYFPFTSPSWELEVLYQGSWLEILGCGIVQHSILDGAGAGDRAGWAFGLGLERVAMLLFGIPDIRLFWSTDERFLGQFRGLGMEGAWPRFEAFSKYPACYKDVAFWVAEHTGSTAGGGGAGPAPSATTAGFHENDVMELVRGVGGNIVEDVRLVDEFRHPKTGRRSLCYRINYRSLERTLTNEEVNGLHEGVRRELVEKLGVELR